MTLKRKTIIITYSSYICALKGFLETMFEGLVIIPHSEGLMKENEKNNKKEYTSGRVYYTTKTIYIDEPSAKNALMTLAHEGGHFWNYIRNNEGKKNNTPDNKVREKWAYLLGWLLIKLIGSDKLITKKDWREHHSEIQELQI